MGVIKGGAVRAYYGTSAIGHATSCQLALQSKTVENDSKDIDTYPEFQVLKVTGTLAVDAFFSYSTSNTKPFDLARLMLAKTPLTLKVESTTAGNDGFQFTGVISNMSFEHTVNTISVYSVAFQITGTITIDTTGAGEADTTVIGDSEGTVIGDSSGIVIGW